MVVCTTLTSPPSTNRHRNYPVERLTDFVAQVFKWSPRIRTSQQTAFLIQSPPRRSIANECANYMAIAHIVVRRCVAAISFVLPDMKVIPILPTWLTKLADWCLQLRISVAWYEHVSLIQNKIIRWFIISYWNISVQSQLAIPHNLSSTFDEV